MDTASLFFALLNLTDETSLPSSIRVKHWRKMWTFHVVVVGKGIALAAVHAEAERRADSVAYDADK
jgi:hypothetical protein